MSLFNPRLSRSRAEREVLQREVTELRAALAADSEETARILRLAAGRLAGGVDPARVADALALLSDLSLPSPPLARAPIAVAGPLAELIEGYRVRVGYPEREVLYIEDGGRDWLTAFIDRALFVRAIGELLENCLDHAGGWSRITVTSEPVPGAILVRVRDDGRGIPNTTAGQTGSSRSGDGHRSHLETEVAPSPPGSAAGPPVLSATGAPVDGATRPIAPGTWEGLGLAIVRRIVTAHGGRVEFSTHEGHGTAVSTWWPVIRAVPDTPGDPA